MTTPSIAGIYWTPALTQTAVQTSAFTAAANELVPVDTTSRSVTITLPAGPPAGTLVGVKMVTLGGSNTVTIAAQSWDLFNKATGSATLTLSLLNQGVLLEYNSGIWLVVSDDLPLTALDARYLALSGGTLTGILHAGAGTDSSGSAPVLTSVAGTNGGGGVQLTDTTRDYTVYLQVGTAGSAWIVSMGHTNSANDVTVHASGTATAGQTLAFRLPAGWYFLWSATTATLAQSVAVGC